MVSKVEKLCPYRFVLTSWKTYIACSLSRKTKYWKRYGKIWRKLSWKVGFDKIILGIFFKTFFLSVATLYEIEIVQNECKGLIRNLKNMAKNSPLPMNMLAVLDSGYVKKEPYGVVLILGKSCRALVNSNLNDFNLLHVTGAWNYPFLLTLQPMAGNRKLFQF